VDEAISDVFFQAVDQYRIMNNYIHVVPCRDVNDVYAFHQNELHLIEGDMPDPAVPYTCVITNDIATRLGLKPGDTVSMDELQGTAEDRYNLALTGEAHTYTVSGIIGDSPNFRGVMWAIAEDADTPLFGYLLGTVSLRNAEAETAVEALRSLVPAQVRVTLLDQGYGSAVQPFQEVKKTAVNVLLICSAGIAAILLLFAFLYVGRQQRVTINNTHYYVDMVFYNKILKAYVLIELKRKKLTPEAAGQLNMYLNYYQNEVNDEGDNPPVGIILCTEKDSIATEYALGGLSNNIFASRYVLYMPNKEELIAQVEAVLEKKEN
jgi:hypothetical protein